MSATPSGAGVIDLGLEAGVFVGQRFYVYVVFARRLPEHACEYYTYEIKGTCVVTETLGPQASVIRTLTLIDPAHLPAPGDPIFNPFFDRKRSVHVWLAPGVGQRRDRVESALIKHGATIDATVQLDTDYIVISDEMAHAIEAERAGDAGVHVPEWDELENLARWADARVIAEGSVRQIVDY